jgi:predicted nucleic-acid-binding Zn-ribbon protein
LSKKEKKLELFTLEELSLLSYRQLIAISNKTRWGRSHKQIKQQVNEELKRRDPRKNWVCKSCGNSKFHEKQIRVSGGFFESYLDWDRNKYHAVVCDYCAKTEFYYRRLSPIQDALDLFGG